ncbi:hypothetical protein I6I09_07710 [Corynebacterium bovis]|uniref:hypothetical protein n=1 Tax=Corynebacterium bovis TaxID=36808 RepID=UPI0018E137EA|nr:hypothetical protein [Corynebacterium bovis]QQC46965.1 hypothetical protein I6I09_07710 [Corynebacterium bovis]
MPGGRGVAGRRVRSVAGAVQGAAQGAVQGVDERLVRRDDRGDGGVGAVRGVSVAAGPRAGAAGGPVEAGAVAARDRAVVRDPEQQVEQVARVVHRAAGVTDALPGDGRAVDEADVRDARWSVHGDVGTGVPGGP